jgi:class 3 adenylate cyclase/tetratricopeptide (TPR) repeat protein
MDLGRYAETFAENDIDGALLRELTAEDLKELGVSSLGHRKKLLAAIAGLEGQDDAAAAPVPAEDAEGERRQVTILFADLAGFTTLSEQLDPEALHSLVDRFCRCVDGIVESNGGRVDKHIGDAVMALFGAPLAHDDDPMRAVHTALDIHAAMGDLSRECGHDLAVHVGVASGQVVAAGVGAGSHQDYTVIGESVNLAARLQDKAEAGETLLSDAVYRTLPQRVACDSHGVVAVKGLSEPVRIWRLLGLAQTEEPASRAPLIGRQAERMQFSGILQACLDSATGQTILLRGEAGIGKTRLLEEFTAVARAKGMVPHKGLVLDFGVGKGQGAVRALVRSLLAVPSRDSEQDRQDAVDRAVAGGLVGEDQRVFLNDLLNLPQPTLLRAIYDAMDNDARNQAKRRVIVTLVTALSRSTPLLLIIEDVHWADTLTLAHLAELAVAVGDLPALLILTSRIEGDLLDSSWRARLGGSPITTMDLGPLRAAEAEAFCRSFDHVLGEVAKTCIARSEGNPLFLEQLLLNAGESLDDSMPATLQSLVTARMDRLPSRDRRAIQAASVLGQRFDRKALCHLAEDPGYDCTRLIDDRLAQPAGDALLFAHALIQEGIYASLLTPRRRALHVRAADWYAEKDPTLRAEHLDRAEDPGAPMAYHAAVEAQLADYHFDHASRLVERGLVIAKERSDRFRLTCLKGLVLQRHGAMAESIGLYTQALELAENDRERCDAWFGQAAAMRVTDEHEPALAALDKAEAAALAEDLPRQLSLIHHTRGNLYFPLGRDADCHREHEQALHFARLAEAPDCEAQALGGLGDACYVAGRMATSHDYFRRSVDIALKHGLGRIEVANNAMVAHTAVYLGDLTEAASYARSVVERAVEVGNHRAELNACLAAFFAMVDIEELDAAVQYLDRSDELVRLLGARRFATSPLNWRARMFLAQDRRDEALALARQAADMSRDAIASFDGPRNLSVLALALDPGAEREAIMREAEAMLAAGAVGHNHLWYYRDAIEVKLEERDWTAAEHYAELLAEFTGAEPLAWSDLFIFRGRALAAYGRNPEDAKTWERLRELRDRAVEYHIRTALPALEAALAKTPG